MTAGLTDRVPGWRVAAAFAGGCCGGGTPTLGTLRGCCGGGTPTLGTLRDALAGWLPGWLGTLVPGTVAVGDPGGVAFTAAPATEDLAGGTGPEGAAEGPGGTGPGLVGGEPAATGEALGEDDVTGAVGRPGVIADADCPGVEAVAGAPGTGAITGCPGVIAAAGVPIVGAATGCPGGVGT